MLRKCHASHHPPTCFPGELKGGSIVLETRGGVADVTLAVAADATLHRRDFHRSVARHSAHSERLGPCFLAYLTRKRALQQSTFAACCCRGYGRQAVPEQSRLGLKALGAPADALETLQLRVVLWNGGAQAVLYEAGRQPRPDYRAQQSSYLSLATQALLCACSTDLSYNLLIHHRPPCGLTGR